jgi:hypothetical protein
MIRVDNKLTRSMDWSSPAACSTGIRLAPGWRYVPSTMTMEALWDNVGRPGIAATDTSASTVTALTRAWLDAPAKTSAATAVTIDLPTEAAAVIRDQRASLAAISLPPELHDTQRKEVRAAIAEAFIVGYRAVMAIAAGLALASAGVAWLMIRPASCGGS